MALAKGPLVPRQVGLRSTRALKHLPQLAVSLLAKIFNAVLLTQHFTSVWKHPQVISTLKPGKDLSLPSSYRPISLSDTIGKLFQKILLARILHVSKCGLTYDEQFGFRPRHGTSLQLARLVERITRNLGKRGWLAQFSSTWPKPLIPSGSRASSTS